MIRICFLIRQLNDGGAQRQLLELVKGLDKSRYAITVVTWYAGGRFGPELERVPGVRWVSMDKQGRWDLLPFFLRLVQRMRGLHPDILHSYVAASNLMAVVLKPFLPGTRLVWGVRASNKDLRRYDWLTHLIYRLERALSGRVDLVISNSTAGRDHCVAAGFPSDRTIVIPNGIDAGRFSLDPHSGRRVRSEWGVAPDEKLIGLVGRLDPMKGHPTFLQAARLLAAKRPEVRFACVGDGPDEYRRELVALSDDLGLAGRVVWVPARDDMSAVYNALDASTSSSSYGEGFPNVVAEAMACGVSCVVTDVGDSRWIVGSTGTVVPPEDPAALAAAWDSLLSLPDEARLRLGESSRARIMTCFGRERLIESTCVALERLL